MVTLTSISPVRRSTALAWNPNLRVQGEAQLQTGSHKILLGLGSTSPAQENGKGEPN